MSRAVAVRWWWTGLLPLLSLFLFCLLGTSASATEIPEIDQPVTDLAGVLSERGIASTTEELQRYREKTGVQLAVLVIQTTDGVPIEDYALRVAVQWQGGGADDDRGALLVLATRDRRMRLELGYGLEPYIPDSVAKRILDSAIPSLRKDNFDAAVAAMVEGFIETLNRQDLDGRPVPDSGGWLATFRVFPRPVLGYGLTFLVAMSIGLALAPKGESAKADAAHTPPVAKLAAPWLPIIAIALGAFMWLIGAGALCMIAAFLGAWAGAKVIGKGFDAMVLANLLLLVGGLGAMAFFVGYAVSASARGGILLSVVAQVLVIRGFSRGTVVLSTSAFLDNLGASSSWGGSSSFSSGSSSFGSSSSSFGSSSSYSGGGGSFGGGGASSSW